MKPVFIVTDNVKNFISTMETVKKRMGSDSLAMIWGRAGRGKSRTAKWYATQNDCVYIETMRDWSTLWMYEDILKGITGYEDGKKRSKKDIFRMIVSESALNPKPIILDEADLLGPRLMESIRDFCKVMQVPWALVGEDSLVDLMNRDRRVWSRRCASMHFEPMDASDIVMYCKQAADLTLPPDAAGIISKHSGGDIRLIELIVSAAETIANANKSREITDKMAKTAINKVMPEKWK